MRDATKPSQTPRTLRALRGLLIAASIVPLTAWAQDAEPVTPRAEPAPPAAEPPVPAAEPTPEPATLAPPARESLAPDSGPPAAEPIDVTVREHGKAAQMRESARAVDVIELERDQRYTADLGTVLARTEGISVRRAGGLGSDARLSLNGLTDEQVRVFIDGVPLELAGYPFGVNNIPVELIDRVDVHRGVVPLRLGADALGGAVELIRDERTRGTHANASYQAGSFDTHRLFANGRHYDPRTGLFVRAEGFFDTTRNDYPIEVDLQGPVRIEWLTVRRNNAAYRAGFGSVEAGFVNRSWARKLLLRGFFGDMDKDVPSDRLMGAAYGKVHADRRASGTLLRYESGAFRGFEVDLTAGYNTRRLGLRDLATCTYDWVGRCTYDRAPQRGEGERASDSRVLQRSGLARLTISRQLGVDHVLRLGVSPTFTRRTGRDRALPAGDPDPLQGNRDLLTLVSGLEYQADWLDDRLQTLLFAKHYHLRTRSEELLPTGSFSGVDRTTDQAGGGAALRLRFTQALYAKASYEYATRLPSPDQLFGDSSQLVDPNLRLSPESAHNVNLSTALDWRGTASGDYRGQLALFSRHIDDFIFLMTKSTNTLRYENVQRARVLGIEGNVGWTAPGRWVMLDANATYQDYRNRADDGPFARFKGSRMSNQPWLFANALAQVFARGLMPDEDELSLSWRTSYVHDFVYGWDGANPGGDKIRIPSQLVHTLGLGLVLHRGKVTLGSTLELHNVTDARVYDYLGVQLPGRLVAAKITIGV